MEFNLKGNVIIGHKSLPDWVHCDEAKQLLDEAGESYTYVTSDKWFFGELMQKTSSKNVPQIIMKGEYIGGTPELKIYLENKSEVKWLCLALQNRSRLVWTYDLWFFQR